MIPWQDWVVFPPIAVAFSLIWYGLRKEVRSWGK